MKIFILSLVNPVGSLVYNLLSDCVSHSYSSVLIIFINY